jgi:two-component system NarL family sensor kinase
MRSVLLLLFMLRLAVMHGQNNTHPHINRELMVYDSLMNAGSPGAHEVLMRLNGRASEAAVTGALQTRIYTANARWHVEQGDCDSTMYFARKALSVAQHKPDSMRALLSAGAAHRCNGSQDSSLAAYFHAEQMALAAHDTFVLIRCYFYLGHVHSELGKFDKAADYYRQSNKLAHLSNDHEFTARSELAIASNLADRGLTRQALPVLQRALIQCRQAGLIRQQAIACNNLGILYRELMQYEHALGYFRQSLAIHMQLGNLTEIATEYNNMAMIRMHQDRHAEAIPLLLQAESFSPSFSEIYHNLALCYAETGNYKQAYFYKNIHKHLDDSINGVAMLERTEQLQEEFEAGKRQMEISTLKQENEVKELRNKVFLKQRDIFIGLACMLLFISVLVFFILQQKIRNTRQVNEKDRQIHLQQLDEVMRNSELQSMHTMLDTQEKERRRIAEDLHDRVGSMLSTVKVRFSNLVPPGAVAKQEHTEYEKLSRLIDETCEEIRMVSHNLVSGVLDTFGLVPALNDLKDALSKSGTDISISCYNMEARVPKHIEISLYRIFQELINNTIRHAAATRIDIEINRFENRLSLIYTDNGLGFDTAATVKGIGLRSIQSRIDKLDGSLHIDSGKGNGSTFIITIQLP